LVISLSKTTALTTDVGVPKLFCPVSPKPNNCGDGVGWLGVGWLGVGKLPPVIFGGVEEPPPFPPPPESNFCSLIFLILSKPAVIAAAAATAPNAGPTTGIPANDLYAATADV
jgi:hypothetical protein